MAVKPGQWVTVPVDGGRAVVEVVAVEPGELLVEHDGGAVERVPTFLVETPSGRRVDQTTAQLLGCQVAP